MDLGLKWFANTGKLPLETFCRHTFPPEKNNKISGGNGIFAGYSNAELYSIDFDFFP